MAEFTFNCPECGQHLTAEEDWQDLAVECPSCKKQITVPQITSQQEELVADYDKYVDSETIKKHLDFASLALQSRAYSEAEREYQFVLQENPEHHIALYGEMLSKAYQTSPSTPNLKHIEYSYRKIEQILKNNGVSFEERVELKKTFLRDFIPLIAKENKDVLNELYKNKNDAEFREAVNTINAVNRGIVLSNPEAERQQARGQILFPYLKEILLVKYFIVSIFDIKEIGYEQYLLEQGKALCETTHDIKAEPPELKAKYKNILNAIQQEQINTIATENGISIEEAIDAQKNAKKIGELREQLRGSKFSVGLCFFLSLLWGILSCFGIASAILVYRTGINSEGAQTFFYISLGFILIGILLSAASFMGMKKKRKQILCLEEQINAGEKFEEIVGKTSHPTTKTPAWVIMLIAISSIIGIVSGNALTGIVGGLIFTGTIIFYYRIFKLMFSRR